MDIKFIPLSELHFPLLLRWLETPHVKAWWDQDITWTPKLIKEKYGDYVKEHKQENGVFKRINAHIICIDEIPVGYIQIYGAYDFSRSKPLKGLPEKLGAFDVFIGEEKYIKRGIGARAIADFLDKYSDSYPHVFADPDTHNLAAIRAYEKAGFKKIEEHPDTGEVWMIRESGILLKHIQKRIQNNQQKFQHIRSFNLPLGQYAITGSGALGIRNLREIGDIDIIVNRELWDILAKKYGVTDKNGIKKIVFPGKIVEAFVEGSFYSIPKNNLDPSVSERIAEAEIIEELPFESFKHVIYYKQKMGREKDLRDIAIINAWLKENKV